MMRKRLAFVQPNFQQGPRELNAYYLPYSAGMILSSAWQHPHVRQHWQQGTIVWRRDPIEPTAQDLAQHDLVAFSTYVWNHRYNYALAKRVKEINPQCMTVFGGPEPAVNDPDLFIKESFMDAVIRSEGEQTFAQILAQPMDQWSKIPGLLLNQQGRVLDTGPAQRINDLSKLASPYLTGIFDDLVRDNPGVTWNATLETNRGCPYQCTFCDWGSLTYNKVKLFDLDRVLAELDWIGQHCGFVTIADANFGMFVERDNQIIDHLIQVQKRWNRLTSFSITWAKNQRNEVVDMVHKLIEHSPNFAQGLTVSVQSMDNDVLQNIKRRNLDQHKLDEIFDICDRKNIPVYTEVILGLPGETEASWKENFWRIFRAGNHTGVNILQAQLLENAEMNLLQRRLWQLESIPISDYMSGSHGDLDCPETVEVVVSTKHIPRETMLDLLTWNTFIQTFHINGLTTYLARFMHRYHGLDYSDFYQRLERGLDNQYWLNQEFDRTRSYFHNWLTLGQAAHPDIEGVQIFGWNLVHRVTLLMQQQNLLAVIQDWIGHLVRQEFDLDPDLTDQLLDFQRNYVIDFANIKNLPMIRSYDYDFLGFIQDGSPLVTPCTLRFDTQEDRNMSLTEFLEGMYFYRKRNFGKTTITKIHESPTGMFD
jgi:hypothetical protein